MPGRDKLGISQCQTVDPNFQGHRTWHQRPKKMLGKTCYMLHGDPTTTNLLPMGNKCQWEITCAIPFMGR